MRKNKQKKKHSYIYIFILIVILAVVLTTTYKNNQDGTLQIQSLDENLIIFIDNQRELAQQDINPSFDLREGEHTIVVSKDRFWPWIKDVNIKKHTTSKVQPFFIPQNTSGLLIGEIDSEYTRIISLFQKDLTATSTLANIPDENLSFKESITAIDYYKNRQDVVIISSGDGVYALEIISDNIQNFQPIYRGKNPVFVKKDSSSIYVLDDNNLMLVNY